MNAETQIKRDEFGRLLPGSKGLPGAGRRKTSIEIREAFECDCMDAVKRLHELMYSDDHRVALESIKIWLDRALGKVRERIDITEGTRLNERGGIAALTREAIDRRLAAIDVMEAEAAASDH